MGFWNRVSFSKRHQKAAVIWLTGLPSAGKTTIAEALIERLEKKNRKAEWLDGDMIRKMFSETGFSRQDRDRHIRYVGFLASRLERQGVFVVASLVSPYRDSRDFIRGICENFFEVYVSTHLEECERRDVKGLYARARKGEIANMTGVNDPYEPPLKPEFEIDTLKSSVSESVNVIMSKLGL